MLSNTVMHMWTVFYYALVCLHMCAGVSECSGAFAGLPGPSGDPGSDVCLPLLLLQRVTF